MSQKQLRVETAEEKMNEEDKDTLENGVDGFYAKKGRKGTIRNAEQPTRSAKMQLMSKGLVTEEVAKRLQFPRRKNNKKKQDKHTGTESEMENQYNTIRPLFQSPIGLQVTNNNNIYRKSVHTT